MALRTCLGCKGIADKAELLRFVQREGTIELDSSAKLPGRGAYVHKRAGCVRKVLQPKVLTHRLRHPVDAKGMAALEMLLAELLVRGR